MLSADLVAVRRRGDRLTVVPLTPPERVRAHELADSYLRLAEAHVGQPRGALVEALRHVPVQGHEQRLGRGVLKLVLDRCQFEDGATDDPAELRRLLFERAAQARRQAEDGTCDRAALVGEVAVARGLTPQALESALYADLPEAHRLRAVAPLSAQALVDGYDTAQLQAVLLRAVRVVATVRAAAPGTYRALFRKLKFLRLLHTIERLPAKGDRSSPGDRAGFRLEIDGPFSLFASVTKYGLALALALPAITACDEWTLEAELRWGRDRRPLQLRTGGTCAAARPHEPVMTVSDDVRALLDDLQALQTPWRAAVAQQILDLPGVGVCVPDLVFKHPDHPPVYLEVLGFWNRDAVWKRVEMVRRGLPYAIVFAVSKQLRVSEAALPDDAPGALAVYSRVINARSLLKKVEQAAASLRR